MNLDVENMPYEQVEKIIRKEPLEDHYDLGQELGRCVPKPFLSFFLLQCSRIARTLCTIAKRSLIAGSCWSPRGKFAIVKRCKDKRTGRSYAAKFLRKRRGGRACRDAILVEVDIMRQALGHQRIVTLHEVFESTREMIIILEL